MGAAAGCAEHIVGIERHLMAPLDVSDRASLELAVSKVLAAGGPDAGPSGFGAGQDGPRYSDSSTRSLRRIWYSTCVGCSVVRHSVPSPACM